MDKKFYQSRTLITTVLATAATQLEAFKMMSDLDKILAVAILITYILGRSIEGLKK
jgi:hypothetical protein